ncbi:MAG: ATP-binding protein [Rhodospirillaceae bacterium]
MTDALLPRHLKRELHDALTSARVVNIIGPRQAGKTTLVRDLFGKGRFISFDNEGVLAALESDPLGQLQHLVKAAGDAPVIIDEAQRSKKLALALKMVVDETRRPGQFLLTGSSNIFATAHVTDSLAGRVRTLTMLPLSGAEVHRMGPVLLLDWARRGADAAQLPSPPPCSRDDYIDLIIRGGYPEIRVLNQRARSNRYRDYVDAIVDRDVADLLKIRKTDAMRRLIEQLAVRTANELNVQDLCNAVSLKRDTVEQYLDILTRLSLVTRLGSWTSGEVRREVRHPKIHTIDAGLTSALRNFTPMIFAADANPTALGGLLESFVYTELLKSLPYQQDHWRLYHWRGEHGKEVDVIAEADRTLVCFEMKAAVTVESGDFKHLRSFKSADGPGRSWTVIGVVIYLGKDVLTFGDGLFALPLSMFWAFPEQAPA